MSQGLPVIYSKGQGFDGQFKDGVVGYKTNCFDKEELASSIEKVVKNYALLSKNCVNKVNKFSWDSLSKLYREIYCDIMNKTDLIDKG
jgi:glycosyltransferase involved in cell wall biosynthesis